MTAPTEIEITTTSSKSSSRRALLAGALGGIGAWMAGAIGRASPARAGVDGDVVLGASNNAGTQTSISSTGTGAAFVGINASAFGLAGLSTSDYGVYGSSNSSAGVYAQSTSSSGLLATSGTSSPPAPKPKTGVYGFANQDSGSRGVWGRSPLGHGIHGEATSGVAVFGKSKQGGHALLTRGRVKHEKVSGVASIAAGAASVTLSPGMYVKSGSFVLLTPRVNIGSRGLWFTTNPAAGTITIHMSSSRSSTTKIAWLMLG